MAEVNNRAPSQQQGTRRLLAQEAPEQLPIRLTLRYLSFCATLLAFLALSFLTSNNHHNTNDNNNNDNNNNLPSADAATGHHYSPASAAGFDFRTSMALFALIASAGSAIICYGSAAQMAMARNANPYEEVALGGQVQDLELAAGQPADISNLAEPSRQGGFLGSWLRLPQLPSLPRSAAVPLAPGRDRLQPLPPARAPTPAPTPARGEDALEAVRSEVQGEGTKKDQGEGSKKDLPEAMPMPGLPRLARSSLAASTSAQEKTTANE
ncbi:unnamed protein product [Polarella glacialis]|uniref:Uncharacterized protein n=1 Tax=Polarella glacialis TaxID=89957 RepID=A0A813KR83_POLGL|nr:unnamed protein product [Polarella glacialis]